MLYQLSYLAPTITKRSNSLATQTGLVYPRPAGCWLGTHPYVRFPAPPHAQNTSSRNSTSPRAVLVHCNGCALDPEFTACAVAEKCTATPIISPGNARQRLPSLFAAATTPAVIPTRVRSSAIVAHMPNALATRTRMILSSSSSRRSVVLDTTRTLFS